MVAAVVEVIGVAVVAAVGIDIVLKSERVVVEGGNLDGYCFSNHSVGID